MGLSKTMELKREIRLIAAFDEALDYIGGEIEFLCRPIPELFEELALRGPAALRTFFAGVAEGLFMRPFPELWRERLEALELDGDTLSVLCRLGDYLGRYEAAKQAAEISAARAGLDRIRRRLLARRDKFAAVWPGLGACFGAMLAIILL